MTENQETSSSDKAERRWGLLLDSLVAYRLMFYGIGFGLVLFIAMIPQSSFSTVSREEQEEINQRYEYLLRGEPLPVKVITKGMRIPMYAIVITNPLKQNDCTSEPSRVILSFDLSDVPEEYLWHRRAMKRIPELREGLTIPSREDSSLFELTDDALLITIPSGTVLHLRPEMEPGTTFPFNQFNMFVSDDAVGTVKEVTGRAFVSIDADWVKERLWGLWRDYPGSSPPCLLGVNCIQAPDGTIVWLGRPPRSQTNCHRPCEICELQPLPPGLYHVPPEPNE